MFKKVLRKSSRSCVLILLLVVALLSTACASQAVQPEEPPAEPEATPTARPSGRGAGDTLRILNPQAPTTLNPHLSLSVKDLEASRVTYEPLASFDKDGNLVPFLAVEIPTLENGGVAADGKSVTWRLRQDVKWSDGELFTADDILFTYQFVSNPEVKAATAATYGAVESVQVIDPYTVKVNFKDVNPVWTLPFVGFHGMIIPRHIFEPYNGANAREAPANTLPVGTGPYQVMPPGIKPQEVLLLGAQLVETNKIVLEPNPYFREADKPFFSRVELRGGGTPGEAARLVLQDGRVDYAYQLGQLPLEELAKLETAGQGRLVTNFGSAVERILLNRTDPNRETENGERSSLQFPHPFFSDKRVRQAFAHAINREAIAALYGPIGRPTTNNLVAPPQYSSPNTFYEFDLEKAKALLDEAGWVDTDGDGIRDKDGVKMEVVFQGKVSAAVQQTQQIVKEALEPIGVEVELKIVDPSIMFGPGSANPDSEYRFNAHMLEFYVRSASPDPSSYMQFWTCNQIPQKANNWTGLNIERWCNSEYDALYQQSTTELNPEKRRQLFIQMNDMLIEDVVMIPIVYLADAQGVSRTIEGVDLTPWDASTWNIKDWRRISP
jgi:peptide/nickel transport system substrate-binding protein